MPTPVYNWPTVTLDDTPNAPAQSTMQMSAVDATLHGFADTIAGQPMWQTGTVMVPGGGSVNVTFSPAFPGTPRVLTIAQSPAAVVNGTSVFNTTASGFTLYLDRANTTTTQVRWVACYVRPTS